MIANLNGGVGSEIQGGDPAVSVAEHQVTSDGLITPRPLGAPAPRFALTPTDFEARELVLWSLTLREVP